MPAGRLPPGNQELMSTSTENQNGERMSFENRLSPAMTSEIKVFLCALVVALLALRVGNHNLILASLWAEDGTVFLNQANAIGFHSLWLPYNGYLHLYPRITALLATWLPLSAVPLFFNVSWFLAVAAAVFSLYYFARKQAFGPMTCLLLIACVLLQPSSGETLFTLTNAQWFIGIALILYICGPNNPKPNPATYLALALAALTGPFALIALPVLLVQSLYARKAMPSLGSCLILLICSGIQLYFLINSDRMGGSRVLDTNYQHWLKALWTSLSFGLSSRTGSICALAIWVIFLTATAKQLRSGNRQAITLQISLLFLAGLLLAAGMMTEKQAPHTLSPLGAGSRYYLIPYTLLIVSAFLSFRRYPVLGLLALLLFSIICTKGFMKLDRGELQWPAYTRLAKIAGPLYIPIAPNTGAFPGWSVYTEAPTHPGRTIGLPLENTYTYNVQASIQPEGLGIQPTSSDPLIRFVVPACTDSRYIGVIINAWREQDGFVQMFWGKDFAFDEQHSLRRYYPAGDTTIQFAYERRETDNTVRLDPSENQGKIVIRDIQLSCLGN
uniref:hypothetical protein n=1 Tax=Pseudomonas sp. RW407 TaxID=2202894 RepID=UPI0011B5F1C2|nr:hypothetical protein [Pseudomonas sp. RW407]